MLLWLPGSHLLCNYVKWRPAGLARERKSQRVLIAPDLVLIKYGRDYVITCAGGAQKGRSLAVRDDTPQLKAEGPRHPALQRASERFTSNNGSFL
ncbi:hypothetical protein EVAR_97437_1 [Eumeta japonica]|uniref:Uncharacterized protein n=1 Tax=Eumeta variegata TaxID=151549 RepID=A0A4C1WWU6_EUMVA|nr:hypothetical protein EVAR_97437_1 [Eumeta japonica]